MKNQIWEKSKSNPVLKCDDWGTIFDPFLLIDEPPYPRYRMYFSWRAQNAIGIVESNDARTWSDPRIVLGSYPWPDNREYEINRQCILKKDNLYHMYYSGQSQDRNALGHARIFHASSKDGIHWIRTNDFSFGPERDWEKSGVMCPHVLYDESSATFRMWYSAMHTPGEFYESDAIAYAESKDGFHWERPYPEPIFQASDVRSANLVKVTAAQILKADDWFYMFYIGFETDSRATICLARSRDGIHDWEQYPGNPILSPTPNAWDLDACYKPAVCFDGHDWLLWYNGRNGCKEQIGLAVKHGSRLWE